MEETTMLTILNKLHWLIVRNRSYEAKRLVKQEIENVKGITEQRCKNTKYYFYDFTVSIVIT